MKYVWMAVLLAGCAGEKIVTRPVTVEVPVMVACKTQRVEKPAFEMDRAMTTWGLAEKSRAAMIELYQRKAYEAELEAQIASCQ